jgi:aspartyl-tRNA(Asn)/glutamyl-tRNA(Gln) amidotransferase subunit A
MKPWHEWPARELAVAVQAGQVDVPTVAEHFIDRVQRLNPALNAIVRFDPGRVRVEAAAVQQRLAAGEPLPLAGVPVTVKDNVWVQGQAQQQGSRLFDGFVAPRDAWCVARLRSLGAVVLGITNCSEFACKGVTTNLVHGPTRHPLDPALTPGGSSGGAAAAQAAGLGLLAIGTDAGGSIRRPAAHCGVVGFKPSPGLIPHPWGFAEPNFGLSVIGLMARDVADVAWAFGHLQAYDAADPAAPPLAVDLGPAADPRTLRIAWSPQLGCDLAIDDEVQAQLQACVDALRTAGWAIVDADPDWPEGTREYPLLALQQAGLHALYGARLASERDRIDPDLVAQIEAGGCVTPTELGRVLRLRERIAAALQRFFERIDLLLAPTAPVTAWPLSQLGPPTIGGRPAGPRGHAAFTPLFNYAGVPAVSVPAGLVRGLPVGLQVVGPRFEDARVLAAAAAIAG